MSSLLFPGQGSQVVGMGSEFYNNFGLVKEIFGLADEKLKYPISKIILHGPSDELQLTENTQPAILTVSYSIFMVLKNEFNLDLKSFKFLLVIHGEYSALVCSGAQILMMLYIYCIAGKAMQNAVPVGEGSMIVSGLDIKEVNNIIKNMN